MKIINIPSLVIGAIFSFALAVQAEFVYVANEGSANISAYSVASDGTLTPIGLFAAGSVPFSVAVNPVANFLYVVNEGDDNVSTYSIASDGTLTLIGSSDAGTGPESIAIDPTGKFAYVANIGGSSSISEYSVASNGTLTSIGSIVFATQIGPQSVAVDPTSKFVYVANTFIDTVSAYRIGFNGRLTSIDSFATGRQPSAVVVEPTGKYVYVANFASNTVSGYRIDPKEGGLSPNPNSPFATAATPLFIAADPTTKRKFKYGKELSPRRLECESTQEERSTSITKQLVFQYPFFAVKRAVIEFWSVFFLVE
jgi:DNA-binding beta-propeller fold protein YncE